MISQVEILSIGPQPLIRLSLRADVDRRDHGGIVSAIASLDACSVLRDYFLTDACRGVSVHALSTVIQTGVDVNPTQSPIWVSSIGKAIEYGDWPKLVLVFNPDHLDRTFRELPRDASESERSRVKAVFPTQTCSPDGEGLWFSRLSADDRRLATAYEIAYGYWIPGNAREALAAVISIE